MCIKTPREYIQEYDTKIKTTGKRLQIINYPLTMIRGYSRPHKTERHGGKTMANEYNLKRAQRNVLDIVNTNLTVHTKMVTLTYAKTQLEYEQLNRDFKAFLLNLKRSGFKDLPYLSVVEHQTKRGRREKNAGSLHLHVLLFTDRYIPFEILKKAWGNRGSVDVQALKKIDNVGAYVSKYITKEGQVAEKKSYRTSKNLKKPTVDYTTADLPEILSQLNALKADYSITNTYDYKLKRPFEQDQDDTTCDYEKVKVIQLKQT